jgi:hypothetical protein
MKILKSLILALLLTGMTVSTVAYAETIELADNHPVDYTVVKGDTLWDIAAKFLRDPWRWPEIWRQNKQIVDPDLIYPGDRLVLKYENGKPYLEHLSGRERAAKKVVKMGPVVYVESLDRAIPAIPPKFIMAFLGERDLIDSRSLDALPYVTEGINHEVVLGALSDMYVRNIDGAEGSRFKIIRMRGELVDPDTKKVLGYETETLGEAEMLRPGDPAKMRIIKSNKEINQGDRLVPAVRKVSLPYYHPKPFKQPVKARILGAFSDQGEFGPGDVVTISAGSNQGIAPGDVLQVMRDQGEQKDPVTGEKYRFPLERSGIIMIFKAYDKISYGLIMRASYGIKVYDQVNNFD